MVEGDGSPSAARVLHDCGGGDREHAELRVGKLQHAAL